DTPHQTHEGHPLFCPSLLTNSLSQRHQPTLPLKATPMLLTMEHNTHNRLAHSFLLLSTKLVSCWDQAPRPTQATHIPLLYHGGLRAQTHLSVFPAYYTELSEPAQGETPSQNITAVPTWAPNLTVPFSQVASHAAPDQIGPRHSSGLQHLKPPLPAAMVSRPYLPDPLLDVCGKAIHSQRPTHAAYGGLMQTHQVKNVQVFSGNSDSKMLVEDWIRDMQ
ncbi:hypothetical protein GOODEAATRI_034092, partial [Goodea atripinnis]